MGGSTRRAISKGGPPRPAPWLRRLWPLGDSRQALRCWQRDPLGRWQSQRRAGRELEFRHCSWALRAVATTDGSYMYVVLVTRGSRRGGVWYHILALVRFGEPTIVIDRR